MTQHKSQYLTLVALTAALTLAACGGGGGDGAPAASPAPSPSVSVVKFAALDGAQAGVTTAANGTGLLIVDTGSGAASGSLTIQSAPATAITAAHVHEGAAGASGGVQITLSDAGNGVWAVPAGTVLSAAQVSAFSAGNLYFAVHTTANPAGELRGQLDKSSLTLFARLDGAQEVPPVVTGAAGTGSLAVDAGTGAASGSLTITAAPATAITQAHIHSGDRGANGGIVVGLVDSGGGVWSVPAGTVFTAAQRDLFIAGSLYFNVHTTGNAAGEIRGQLDLIAP